MKNCALTGHRALPPDFDKNALYDGLEALILAGYDCFYCGMAVGFDLAALECLAALKQKYKLRLVACIPFEGQETRFPAADRAVYRTLLGWCDETVVLFPAFRGGCFLARDRYMVDHADALYAYCEKTTGGAAYTVAYAKKTGKQIYKYGETP